jgi:hypothetical protein
MSDPKNSETKVLDPTVGGQDPSSKPGPLPAASRGEAVNDGQEDDEAGSPYTQALLVVISELCFVALPFVVYLIVFSYLGRLTKLFTISEWAFAAVLLLGQSLAKFSTMLMSGRKPKITGKPLIVFVLTLVFGLIPSVIVLIFILLSSETESGAQPASPGAWFPNSLSAAQVLLFVLAVLVYFLLVGANEYAHAEGKHRPTR